MRIYFFLILWFISLIGCERAPVKRTYHEIVQTAPQKSPAPMMPISGELDVSAIPNDDVHAFLRNGQAASTLPAIPDDDIHASLRKGQAASGEPRQGRGAASGAMPMTGAVDPETQKMLEASVARPPLSWVTPQGWQETPGSGMRLVNFTSTDQNDPVECNIISLGGQAGGLESNAARWMQQVNIPVPEAPAMEKFLAAQNKIKTQDGFDATIIDLTQLQPKEDLQSPSMMATIITLPEMTMFVKMTGTRGAVLKNRDKFEALCESLKLN
jgi:hypothetical protein